MKILLAKNRALGDTVLLSSTLELLAKQLPTAKLCALVPSQYISVLEGNPHLHQLWGYGEGWLSLMARIRRESFDYFFQLHASPGNRWLPLFSGANKTSFHYQNKETEVHYGKHPNALEWDGFFLRRVLGIDFPLPAPYPKIFLSAEEESEGKEYWKKWGTDPKKIVFLGLGAGRATKRWLPSHFARLSELLRDRMDLVPALVVGPGEQEEEFAARVINEMRVRGMRPLMGPGRGDFLHIAGLSLRDLAKALAAVRFYVGNDTGAKHMAVALGVPTFTLFGPEDPKEWHPYDDAAHGVFFLPALSCRREDGGRWCGIPVCDLDSPEKHRCMGDLDPLDVFFAIERRKI